MGGFIFKIRETFLVKTTSKIVKKHENQLL